MFSAGERIIVTPVSDRWDTGDIPDLDGATAVVTGGNSGIGFETARALAARGVRTVLACRSEGKGNEAARLLRRETDGRVELMIVDLADLSSIKGFAREFAEQHDRLDLLINNAGIMAVPYGRTPDGLEQQIGTNHMGHFALTGRLLPVLLETAGSRVVTVASMAHRGAAIPAWGNFMYENGGYSPVGAYCRSKLANLLFMFELARWLERNNHQTISVGAHPGTVPTNLANHLKHKWSYKLSVPFLSLFAQPPTMGALPTLRAAADPAVRNGEYYGPGGPFQQKGRPVVVGASRTARSAHHAELLWELSEGLTGVPYELP